MNLVDVERLCEIAEVEFSDVVTDTFSPDINELRIILSIAMTMYLTSVGGRWRPSRVIFMTAAKAMWRRVISARFLQRHCGIS